MTPEEWDSSPWWVTTAYMEGLIDEGVLDDGTKKRSAANAAKGTGTPETPTVDYAESIATVPKGFTVRQA